MSSNLDHHVRALAENPSDPKAFEALEEQYYLVGDWNKLVDLYRQRLGTTEDPPLRAQLLYRAGQVLEERCLEIDSAIRHYTEAVHQDPAFRPALQQLRKLHGDRGAWELVLQIAEVESAVAMPAAERAELFAEMGEVWLQHVRDPDEAMSCFEQALAIDGTEKKALAGLARTLTGREQHREAAAAWERLIAIARGHDRAAPLVALAALLEGPLQQNERAVQCYQLALRADPRNEAAVDALAVDAARREQWPLLAELHERRFQLVAGATRRTAVAVEAGHLQLEALDDAKAAQAWFSRALELCPEDMSVHYGFAELARKLDDDDALIAALRRLIDLAGESCPLAILLEAANLHAERADHERALSLLELAQRRSPDDSIVLEALSDSLASLERYEELACVLERRASLAEEDPDARGAALLELGRLYDSQLADPEAARDACERAFAAHPATAGAAETLERIYRKTESWEALRHMLERAAIDGAPEDRCGFHCSLGELLHEQLSDSEASERAFQAALARMPDSARALTGLEGLARDSGDEAALTSALEGAAAVTRDSERLCELALELHRMHEASDRLEDALKWSERLLDATPRSPEALERVAGLQERLAREDDFAITLGRLEEILEGSERAAVRRRIASFHAARGDEDTAILYWEGALESHPDDLISLNALRELYTGHARAQDLAPILRKLADLAPADEQPATLDQLSRLLEEELGDLDAAIVVLWRLTSCDSPPADAAVRLESLLERSGRFEELVQQLQERRRLLPDESDDAIAIDLRRGQLLLDPLGQLEEAIAAFRSVRQRASHLPGATEGLERALRAANDPHGLAELLGELAEHESDPEQRDRLELERAVLQEETLDDLESARRAYAKLAASDANPEVASEAGRRLESLLERRGEWAALRQHLETTIDAAPPESALALRERLAGLCRDRMEDLEGAAMHLEAAARLRPERPETWQRLAALYAELDRPEDLLRTTEFELEAMPDPEREALLRARAAGMWADQPDQAERAAEHYERLLELELGHSDATEFLVARYQQLGRPNDVVRLLEGRLDSVSAPAEGDQLGAEGDLPGVDGDPQLAEGDLLGDEGDLLGTVADSERALRTSLRLRLSSVLSEELDDHAGAVEALEPTLLDEGPIGPTAAPLAELYRKTGRSEALIDLCGRAERACDSPGEQAIWLLRLGDALRDTGDDPRTADAYRRALQAAPGNREVADSLCDLYRRTDQPAPLAELLEKQLEGVPRSAEVPIRMELARLLEDELGQGDQALAHLQRIIEFESGHSAAFEHALRLANRLERFDEQLQLIDARLERRMPASERAALQERRADLLAGPIGAREQSIASYREAIALDPHRHSARQSLRQALEKLGHWSAVLDCLYIEATAAEPDERAAIFERAVEIAAENLGPDASLPWLERLRAERSEDPGVVARIADVHRLAGRFESVLRALDDELVLTRDPTRQRDLHVARGRILERDLAAPRRAIAALEAAHELARRDAEILQKLDELYGRSGHVKERVATIEARLAYGFGEPLELHRTAAALCRERLGDHERAIPHLLRAVSLTDRSGEETDRSGEETDRSGEETDGSGEDGLVRVSLDARAQLLRDLAETLRKTGDSGGWARASEAELGLRLGPDAPASSGEDAPASDNRMRCAQLRRDLAWAYLDELADSDTAVRHLRAVLQREDAAPPPLPADELDWLERALIDQLRDDSNWVELEQRLSERLKSVPGTGADWLELARLRDERLNSPKAALTAYQASVERCPSSLPAIRGLRGLAECLADWPEVKRALELELELADRLSACERATLLRKLGVVCWRKLNSSEWACRAYAGALEADPSDLIALRSLEELYEKREDWELAIGLYERETEILGDAEPERRRQAWLAAARLARLHCLEPRRALRAYGHADSIQDLDPDDRFSQAELYRTMGDHDRFVEVYTIWCDDPGARASSSEHLVLVHALSDMGRSGEALERARKAVKAGERDGESWDALAKLLQDANEPAEAADALARAAELHQGRDAAVRLVDASSLREPDDLEGAHELLGRAVAADPGWATAYAHVARTAKELELWEEAEAAAGRCLDLATAIDDDAPPRELQLATVLAGGVAARQRDRLDAAAVFFRAALAIEPSHREALEAQGQVLFERGELTGARRALEAHLNLEGGEASRAERLATLATILELEGEQAAAIARFEEALEADPDHATAHAGMARLHEKAGRIDQAVAALEQWARAARASTDPASFAARMLHAGELELGRDHVAGAERLIRCAVAASPANARAWVLLTEILWDANRVDEVLRLAPQALLGEEVTEVPDAVARLALLYGRALERRNDETNARGAYAEVLQYDGRCSEAALALSRLSRKCGDWQGAADVLKAFSDGHPDPNHRDLAEVQYKLARLLAGPLEDVEGAIRAYERALELSPDHRRAREPLASLLVHLPERWKEAIRHHTLLLKSDPSRSASLRSLQQIAERRGQEDASLFGLTILCALGTASPAERSRAPETLSPPVRGAQELADPIWEIARQVAQHASEALEQVLDTGSGDSATISEAPESFLARIPALEKELAAAALVGLSDSEIADLLYIVAHLAIGEDSDEALELDAEGTELTNAMEFALGRWTRRKIRRSLDGTSPNQLRSIDFEAWRAAIRGLAAAQALELLEWNLRAALVAMSVAPDEAPEIAPTDDLTARIASSQVACDLLRQLEAAWCADLVRD